MKKELLRKGFHVLFGAAFLLLIYILGPKQSVSIIEAFFILGVIISVAMLRGIKIPFLSKTVEKVERDNEKKFPGKAAVFFFGSAIILLILFKSTPQIILASISVQVFADSAAALIGKPFGKHKLYKKKTWEGSITCFIVAFLCILFFFNWQVALIGALVATIVEALPLDDNLFVPLITAAAIRGLI